MSRLHCIFLLHMMKFHKQIAICNDNYKFVTFSHNILREFLAINEVTSMFHHEIVMMLHSQCTCL